MWLPRPVYESLPYAYMFAGSGLLAVSFLVTAGSGWLLGGGAVLLALGLILWLRRRDYRTGAAEYSRQSLDD